jgi:hypothetical protein
VVMIGPSAAALGVLPTATQPRPSRSDSNSFAQTNAGAVGGTPEVRPGRPSPSVEAP